MMLIETDMSSAGSWLWTSTMGAVEHHLALIEPGLLDEPQIDLLAGQADDLPIIIFVIFAPIAGAEIADGEEREIMVVRHGGRRRARRRSP